MIDPTVPWCFERPAIPMTAHEVALLRHPELVEQIKAERADPISAVRSEARRPRRD